jgi:hypothetical protein
VIVRVCASKDIKRELIRGDVEGKLSWGTKAGHPNSERECASTEDRSHHIRGTRAVTKTLVARHELERIALQEIRSSSAASM